MLEVIEVAGKKSHAVEMVLVVVVVYSTHQGKAIEKELDEVEQE